MGQAERFKRAQLERQRAQMEGHFAKLVASGDAKVMALDRFGMPIKVGDEILFKPPFDWVFKVQSIDPILDPRAPVGLITMVLAAVAPVHVQAGQPLMNATIVLSAESAAEGLAAVPAQPEAETPLAPPDEADPSPIVLTDVQ